MALDVVTASGMLRVINFHGQGSDGDSWAPKVSLWADVPMYPATRSAGGTRPVLIGGDFNVWFESPAHAIMKRFVALWEHCGFQRAWHLWDEDPRPTREGHQLDSHVLNAPLVPWAVCEHPYLAPG